MGCSTAWPGGSGSTRGRSGGATRSRSATGSGPDSCSARAAGSRRASRPCETATPGRGSPVSGGALQVVKLDDGGRVEKVIAAHDVGRVMNPTLLEGQIEGAVHMGLGFALSAAYVVEDGGPAAT